MEQNYDQQIYPPMDFSCPPWYSYYQPPYEQPYQLSQDQAYHQSMFDQQLYQPSYPAVQINQPCPGYDRYDQIYQPPYYNQQSYQSPDFTNQNQWCSYPLVQNQQPNLPSEPVVHFPALPTTLSYEMYEDLQQNVSCKSKENFIVEPEEPKLQSTNVEDSGPPEISGSPLIVPPTVLANDEKIRFRNRDYYGLPVQVNVTKGNCSNQTVLYNLSTKKKAGSKQRSYVKRSSRNPLSTKLTVKNLKKLLEMQEQMGVLSSNSRNSANANSSAIKENAETAMAARAISDETAAIGVRDHYERMNLGKVSLPSESLPTFDKVFRKSTPVTRSGNGSSTIIDSDLSKNNNEYNKRLRSSCSKKATLRNRSYEFDSLQIGSFTAVSNKQNLSRNKLRFYFSQNEVRFTPAVCRLLVYDFEYDYHIYNLNTSVIMEVMLYINLDSIERAIFRSREIEFLLNQPPRIVTGFDRSKIPAILRGTNFGTTPVDVTNGQLYSVFFHKINLPRAQGALIEKQFLEYHNALK